MGAKVTFRQVLISMVILAGIVTFCFCLDIRSIDSISYICVEAKSEISDDPEEEAHIYQTLYIRVSVFYYNMFYYNNHICLQTSQNIFVSRK